VLFSDSSSIGSDPKSNWVPWLIHKAKTGEPKTELEQHQTGLTSEEHRSDRCATTQSRIFEVEDMHRDHKALVGLNLAMDSS
jgi:hypothetical protein